MNVDTLVKTTLEKLGCPVERLKYDGKAKTFITYQIVVLQDKHFSDDESGAGGIHVQGGYLFPRRLYRPYAERKAGIEGSGVLRDHV